jgi:hypothetical protein
LLAYCGLYCGDCLGYTGVIADAAKTFKETLDRYRFDLTAKSIFPEELKNYEAFYEALGFMTGLRCPRICREVGDAVTSCEVRRCCRGRGFYACFECDDLEACDKLRSAFGGLHADSCLKNLRAVREMGLENWVTKGRRHHYWDEREDRP